VRWWNRGNDRRALPAAERPDDGGLFFVDRTGRRWAVYDRRGSDRRQLTAAVQPVLALPNGEGGGLPDGNVSENDVTRLFVSGSQSLSTPLAENEIAAVSVADLEEQFLRATPVG
jgi:hypothetical protein